MTRLQWTLLLGLVFLSFARAEEEEMSEEEIEEEEHGIKFGFVLGLMALSGTFIFGYLLEHNEINWLPEAGVGVLMGVLAAGIAHFGGMKIIEQHDKFDFEFFMIFLLPPIIFDAGYNMDVKAFLANLGPTMFFAFIGTFASTFVVGGIVYYAGQYGYCYPLGGLASLTFGSLISATDPVTVLAVFSKLGVHVDLFSMVFGESVLNDAVAIVLSRTLLGFNEPGAEVNTASILAAVASFCTIFGGSLLIGGVYGLLSAWVFKALDMRHHEDLLFMQCALSFTFPFAAYYTTEGLALSGIVAIMFCGMVSSLEQTSTRKQKHAPLSLSHPLLPPTGDEHVHQTELLRDRKGPDRKGLPLGRHARGDIHLRLLRHARSTL